MAKKKRVCFSSLLNRGDHITEEINFFFLTYKKQFFLGTSDRLKPFRFIFRIRPACRKHVLILNKLVGDECVLFGGRRCIRWRRAVGGWFRLQFLFWRWRWGIGRLVIGGLLVGGADGFAPVIGAEGVDVFVLGE